MKFTQLSKVVNYLLKKSENNLILLVKIYGITGFQPLLSMSAEKCFAQPAELQKKCWSTTPSVTSLGLLNCIQPRRGLNTAPLPRSHCTLNRDTKEAWRGILHISTTCSSCASSSASVQTHLKVSEEKVNKVGEQRDLMQVTQASMGRATNRTLSSWFCGTMHH